MSRVARPNDRFRGPLPLQTKTGEDARPSTNSGDALASHLRHMHRKARLWQQ
jgi:hypothetical protein